MHRNTCTMKGEISLRKILKILLKDTQVKKWENIPCSWIRKLRMAFLHSLVYNLNTNTN